jgi:hypothetical protein
MPNANWSNPTLTSAYTNFVTEVKNRDEDLALQFDGTTSTNIPTNTIRWDSAANRWKKWNGSSWVELTGTYALTALSTTGNANVGGTLAVTGAATLSSTLAVTGAVTGSSTVSGTALVPTAATVPTVGTYLPAANTVAIATASTERVRVGPAGQVGVAGANYGTAGQVLTSAGPSAAPSWQTPSDATIALSRLAAGALPTNVTVASANIVDGSIVDADVNASANINGTKITAGTTSVRGTLQLTNSTTSTNTTTAATPANVKTAVDNAASAQSTANAALPKAGGTMTGNVNFTAAQPRVARAWANFETVNPTSIRASFNIASFTDLETGSTRLTFTNAMPDTNYAVVGAGSTSGSGAVIVRPVERNTANVRITTEGGNGGDLDADYIGIAIFR